MRSRKQKGNAYYVHRNAISVCMILHATSVGYCESKSSNKGVAVSDSVAMNISHGDVSGNTQKTSWISHVFSETVKHENGVVSLYWYESPFPIVCDDFDVSF